MYRPEVLLLIRETTKEVNQVYYKTVEDNIAASAEPSSWSASSSEWDSEYWLATSLMNTLPTKTTATISRATRRRLAERLSASIWQCERRLQDRAVFDAD